MAKEKDSKVKGENKHFMKDVRAELKKVTWPSSKQMINNVTAVIVIVVVTAVIVACLDLAFGAINEYGIDKIKENVQSKNSIQNQEVQSITPDTQSNGEQSGEQQSSDEQTENIENNASIENNTENAQNTESIDNNN